MAKLYFHYSTMNAGKSTALLQADYNYRERGMQTLRLTAAVDRRAGLGRIASRIGISTDALAFEGDTDFRNTSVDTIWGEFQRLTNSYAPSTTTAPSP